MPSAIPPWVDIVSGDWAGDTASFTLGTGTVTANAGDKNVHTSATFIGASEDFDFEVVCGTFSASAGHGLVVGGFTTGTGTGGEIPTTINPTVWAKNSGGGVGWSSGNAVQEVSKTNGWMSTATILFSRRGSTFYGYLNGSLDVTYTSVTSAAAGRLFIGSPAAGSGYAVTGVRYRKGAGLP